jgi:4-aminobutyrate aminotransferase/(S)-3-amino-2-methylpropionate transaminase
MADARASPISFVGLPMKHNDELENLWTPIPGPKSAELWPLLREYESRNVTFLSDRFPIAWESASGATVTDRDGNQYIDLTAAFGVANVGHANPRVVAAITEQAQKLPHGMGDIHPNDVKALLLRRIAQIAPRGLTKTFLATTGSEAVEAALKTAMLATGKHAFAAYRNAYHGLSFGTLAVSGIEKFRHPFVDAIADSTLFLDFPHATHGRDRREVLEEAMANTQRSLDARDDLAALIIEPIQGRGGINVPPHGYLTGLRKLCSERGILLIFDEIFTGFGRTGKWFDCFHENVVPDILCLGKAMGGGMPISAAVATATIMDVWPH